ncbi:MAG: NAD(P)-dependent glycerol-3-phosphate dehydrogenase [Lentisphaerae bacterium]|nr:NAD(P)-dependent glycerol-3-phosphate dehydrogenase [Lentisphaerota bacterium]
MKACVVGDGAWGTALALVLSDNGHTVSVWSPFPDYAGEVEAARENRRFLPDAAIPDRVRFTGSREDAVDGADLAVLAVPTKYYRDTVASFAGLLRDGLPVVSVAKGLEPDSCRRMSEVADAALGIHGTAALSGPSHAEEVARRMPTAVTVASPDRELATFLQTAFSNSRFRVYTTDDMVGVELGGALKNVIAIAVGVSDGIGFGDNARAALITRGLVEISRIGAVMGAHPATFAGLSGLGDLIVTCSSRLSRNRGIGERIGRGEVVSKILGDMKQAAEGVWNCAQARQLAREHGVDAPITEEVCAMVHEGKPPIESVRDLMERDVKPERPHASSAAAEAAR